MNFDTKRPFFSKLNIMDNLDYSEEEILEQLALLGHKNIPRHRILKYKQDLDKLIRLGQSEILVPTTQTATSQPSPPAYIKEKVCPSYSEGSGNGFFLHAEKTNHDRKLFTTCESRNHGCQQGGFDSYVQHSVAPKLRLPPGAPNRLQVELDAEDTLESLSDRSSSSSDSQLRCFIKRKVLRKHEGKSLVCDESVYSEGSAGGAVWRKRRFQANLLSAILKPSASTDPRLHTLAEAGVSTMYKMCNTQSDEESDDKNSLSSSFWSDFEADDDDDEMNINSKPVDNPEAPLEKLEQNIQGFFTGEGLEEESDDDDGDGDDEEDISSSSSCSPAPSLMTSGYGTYRAEEPEGADHRDDHTIVEFETDSRGGFSEMKDDEEDCRSPCSCDEFDTEVTHEPDLRDPPAGLLEKRVADVAGFGNDGKINITDLKPGQEEQQHQYEVIKSEERLPIETFLLEACLEDGLDLKEWSNANAEDKVETDDPGQSSSNTDIKFIDTEVDFSWMEKMHEEWEGSLRHKKAAASCLEEQMADMDLATAQKDQEAEDEVVPDDSQTQSSEDDDISLSTFESYIRAMACSQSDGDVRPKPKSFIRPVISQQNIKKTDPVARYHQYKQVWEMFKLPGERDRKALHWEIKEKLAYQPPPPKPRRVYVPNTYVVPTEKKRSALRWEIRNDLANGFLPQRVNYQF